MILHILNSPIICNLPYSSNKYLPCLSFLNLGSCIVFNWCEIVFSVLIFSVL